MALRHTLRLLKTAFPAMCGAGVLFARSEEGNSSKNDEKIVELNTANLKKLSYNSMIKQTAVDSVNSASLALTVGYSAIEETSKEYRIRLSKLISLLEDTLIYEVTDDHEDLIIAVRSEVQHQKKILADLIAYMDYVERVAEAVTVMSQSAGMDNLAMSLAQRMDDALQHKEKEMRENKRIELEYFILEEKCIKSGSEK